MGLRDSLVEFDVMTGLSRKRRKEIPETWIRPRQAHEHFHHINRLKPAALRLMQSTNDCYLSGITLPQLPLSDWGLLASTHTGLQALSTC